ncbi:MAG: hypothetical protein JJ992_04025 [Planctomycetes bacterium]|nr:hypothetical protein [Planctomycetota bacterium]
MSPPAFSLNSILRLRRVHREQCGRQWTEARETETSAGQLLAELQDRLHRLHGRLRETITPGTLNVEELLGLKSLERSLRAQLFESQQRCRQAAEHSLQQQAALAEADEQVRVLERLADRQQQQQQRELAAKQLRELDDARGARSANQ